MGKNFEEISVIVPVYKDDARLKNNLPKIRKYLEKNFARFEIILALDPPAGDVKKIARNIYPGTKGIINKKRKGKGYSVKDCKNSTECWLIISAREKTWLRPRNICLKQVKKP